MDVPEAAVPPGPAFEAVPKLLIVLMVVVPVPVVPDTAPPGAPEVTVELFVLRDASLPEYDGELLEEPDVPVYAPFAAKLYATLSMVTVQLAAILPSA